MEKIRAKFEGYQLRDVSYDRDVLTLASWISGDPYHHHLKPAFFVGQIEGEDGVFRPDPRPNCYAMEDDNGVIFYIRIDRAARVRIQFDPTKQSISDRARVARALVRGMAILEVGLQKANVSEWIFDTNSAGLKGVAKARLGFVESPYELVRVIPILRPQQRQEGPTEAPQKPSEEV